MKQENVFTLAKTITMDHTIIEMQFNILHRIIGTSKLLSKIGKMNSPTCCHCKMYVETIETIEYLFYECFIIKNFRFALIKLWNQLLNREVELNCKTVILGYSVENINGQVVDNIFIF